MSLKVFGLPASTDVSRVLTCLFEKEVEFQLIRVDTYKKDDKVPEFLRLQDPSGKVALKDGKLTFVESRAICLYLCDKYSNQGNKSLLGTKEDGSLQRRSIEQWLKAESLNFDPPSSTLVLQLAFAPRLGLKQDPSLIEQSEAKLSKVLDAYEQILGESRFLAGDEFTLADLSHLPNTSYLVNSTDRRSLITSRKNVGRWWDEISKRDSWTKVVDMQKASPPQPS